VIVLLADHNIVGQARLLLGTLEALGWVELLDLRLATFDEAGLHDASTDREVWHRAQELGMLLLTDNRNSEGPDSLAQTLLDASTPAALPVLTVGNAQRLKRDREYRVSCAERVAEIAIDLETYRGVSRLFIP
jgi:hypothetical protein